MISPSNTFVGLTRSPSGGPTTLPLYPEGIRSYVRVVTHDPAQGIAAAYLADRLGARRVGVVHQDLHDPYVRGLTIGFLRAAEGLGLSVSQHEWPFRDSYVELAAAVARDRPDVVFVAGLTQANAKTLVSKTKVVNGILGSFSFDRLGDIVPAPVGVYRFEGREIVVKGVVRAPLDVIGG